MKYLPGILILLISLLSFGCFKEASIQTKNYPLLTTGEAISESDGVLLSAEIKDPGTEKIYQYGFVWSQHEKPLLTDLKIILTTAAKAGSYSYKISSDLASNQNYYVRAFARTSSNEIYGNEISFKPNTSWLTKISGFIPKSGKPGTRVEISLENFAAFIPGNKVMLGDIEVQIDSANENKLFVKVPKVTSPQISKITVQTNGKSIISAEDFEIIYPWLRKNDFSGPELFDAICFSINGKAYFCLISKASIGPSSDVWEYDPVIDTWTQKNNFPGKNRYNAQYFTAGGKGYMCLGKGYNTAENLKELWEYNPVDDQWTRKADFPGDWRTNTIAINIGNKGYICPGINWVNGNDQYYKDFWEYDPSTNSWLKKADFPGHNITYEYGFSVGTNGYVGTGMNGLQEFYKYDQNNNTWSKISSYPGLGYYYLKGFSLNGKSYMGFGGFESTINDFWEFNPDDNSWTKMTPCPLAFGPVVGFSINDKGYLAVGTALWGRYYKTICQFDPGKNK